MFSKIMFPFTLAHSLNYFHPVFVLYTNSLKRPVIFVLEKISRNVCIQKKYFKIGLRSYISICITFQITPTDENLGVSV